MYSCSVIIVAYNSCDFIPACLKSVRDACADIDAEIIVLDNGSKEPILPEIKKFFPEVIWIDSKENLGFGKGCNLAEKRATKPYLFFINPDTIVSRDSFTKVLDFMEVHPESGTVGCRILNEDGSLQWACRRSFPTIVSAVSKTIGLAALFPKNKTLASYNMTYADPDEVVFTGCATESDNAAIRGAADWFGRELKVITTAVEHPAVLQPVRRLKALGHETVELGVDGLGNLDLDALRRELASKGPKLVSVMWANNETGVVFPMEEIAQICREHGAILHTDAVQVAGKIPVDVRKVPVDMLSMSGHKFHAPKGIGIMYIRGGTKAKPFMLGGHQERGRRAGTENVPYIMGLAKACEMARLGMAAEGERLGRLRDRLEQGILATCPDVRVNGDRSRRLPNTLNVSFEYVEGDHVIRAMGVPFTAVHGSVRFSLSRYTTDEDIDYALSHIGPVIRGLRELSPFGPGSDVTTYS